jgi:hypothetical protein
VQPLAKSPTLKTLLFISSPIVCRQLTTVHSSQSLLSSFYTFFLLLSFSFDCSQMTTVHFTQPLFYLHSSLLSFFFSLFFSILMMRGANSAPLTALQCSNPRGQHSHARAQLLSFPAHAPLTSRPADDTLKRLTKGGIMTN